LRRSNGWPLAWGLRSARQYYSRTRPLQIQGPPRFKDIPSSAGFRPLVGSYGCRRKSRLGARRFGRRYNSPGRGRPGSYSTPVCLGWLVPPDGSSFMGILLQVPIAKCGLNSHPGWVSPGGSIMSEAMQRVRLISPVELFDFEACLRVRAFQFTRGSCSIVKFISHTPLP
jgi:hypothetical protein